MKNVIKKIWEAKQNIVSTKHKKEGWNDYSKYNYFTPEQVKLLAAEQEKALNILFKFDFDRDQFGSYGLLTVYDLESGEAISFKAATQIPEIKATNAAQQHGGAMTFTERYLIQFALGISDNTLDPDTTENTKKRVHPEVKPQKKVDIAAIVKELETCQSVDDMRKVWAKVPTDAREQLKETFAAKRAELEAG
jgi:hypothetical protein